MTDRIKIGYSCLGITPYLEAYEIQEKLRKLLLSRETEYSGFFLFLSHLPVITLGKYSDDSNLLVNRKVLRERGVDVYEADRGGDATCHEPGQLVIYPILNLKDFKMGLKQYVRFLESTLIEFLSRLDIKSSVNQTRPGVWIGNDKIASLGIGVKRHCTKHGVALNINNNMDIFQYINPCGFQDIGITSVKDQLGSEIPLINCKHMIRDILSETLNCSFIDIESDDLLYDVPVQKRSFA